jgi:DNA polymerase-3 subunit gamma/tau
LRLVIRELSRLTRDLLVLTVDPSRVADPEIAAEAERQAVLDLAKRFSAEDLMRAFDVLTKAEVDIRASLQPRYHLEMALLRWIHLRRLVPITDLIESLEKGGGAPATRAVGAPGPRPPAEPPRPPVRTAPPAPRAGNAATVRAIDERRNAATAPASASAPAKPAAAPLDASGLKDAFLEEIKKSKKFFHGTVVAQAQRIDVEGDRIVFVYGPQHRALRSQLEQNRQWLEMTASELAGRRLSVVASEGPSAGGAQPATSTTEAPKTDDRQNALKQQALADSGVQALLDVFAAEIKDVEEMEPDKDRYR